MSKKKLAKSVGAVAVAGAIAVGATFAWTGQTQRARNEAEGVVNPGGRLHDDYFIQDAEAVLNGATKRVYVENYSNQPLFVRVKLREFMRLGVDSVVTADDATAPELDTPGSWHTYTLDDASTFRSYWNWKVDGGTQTKVWYLPTFNMNKDSVVPDVNGSWAGKFQDYIDWEALKDAAAGAGEALKVPAYQTFVAADAGAGTAAGVAGWEVHDADGNADDDPNLSVGTGYDVGIDTRERDKYVFGKNFIDTDTGALDFSSSKTGITGSDGTTAISFADAVTAYNDATDPTAKAEALEVVQKFWRYNTTAPDTDITVGTEDADGKLAQKTHEIKQTDETKDVVSTATWQGWEPNVQKGAYWVCDNSDGWFYWAEPLQPGEATGCLLTGYTSVTAPGDDWYYAIDVDMQCVTEDSLGTFKLETEAGVTDDNKIGLDGREVLYRAADRDPITGGKVVDYRSKDVSVVQFGGFYKTEDSTTMPLARATIPFPEGYAGFHDTTINQLGITGNLEAYNNTETYSFGDTPTNEANAIQWVKIRDTANNKYMYICDRSLLASVSWDQLSGADTTNKPFDVDNTANYTLNTGVPTVIDSATYTLRLLTGGIASSGSNVGGNSYDGNCLTNLSDPTSISEWDRYIGGYGGIAGLPVPVAADVDNVAQETDFTNSHNRLWHWTGAWSWCQDKVDYNGAGTASHRANRGSYSARYWSCHTPGDHDARLCFRPCFEVAITAP